MAGVFTNSIIAFTASGLASEIWASSFENVAKYLVRKVKESLLKLQIKENQFVTQREHFYQIKLCTNEITFYYP